MAPGSSPTGTPNQCWLSVDLYLTLAALAQLGAGQFSAKVRNVFEMPARGCPEIIAVGAAAAMAEDPTCAPFLADVCAAVLPPYLVSPGHPSAPVVLHRVWASGQHGQECVARAMAETHAREGRRARPAHAGRVPGSQGAVRGFGQSAPRLRRRARGAGGEAGVPQPGEVAAGEVRGVWGAVRRHLRPIPPHEGDGRR